MALSTRGQRAIQSSPFSAYFSKQLEGVKLGIHSPSNPEGYVLLAVAENGINFDMAIQKLASCREVDPSAGTYDNMCGREQFRRSFAKLMSATAVRASINPDNLVVGSGCGGLINELAFLLMDAGQSVLLPTPTYGALYNDFGVLADIHVQDVPCEPSDGYRITVSALERAFQDAKDKDRPCGMLFLINPCNPLGIVHREDYMRDAIEWARGHELHIVVDEIYANSVWGEGGPPFVSALDLAPCTTDVHVLWGLSKDFAMSGFRVGVLHSHNATLLAAMSNANYFTTVSNDTQDAIAIMCEDIPWCISFFQANSAALSRSYQILAQALTDMGLPFVQAYAGMFVWVDCRQLLDRSTGTEEGESQFACERRLVNALWSECKLLMTPGEACHGSEPGFFRCCFVWMHEDSVREGMRRLEAFVGRRRAMCRTEA